MHRHRFADGAREVNTIVFSSSSSNFDVLTIVAFESVQWSCIVVQFKLQRSQPERLIRLIQSTADVAIYVDTRFTFEPLRVREFSPKSVLMIFFR